MMNIQNKSVLIWATLKYNKESECSTSQTQVIYYSGKYDDQYDGEHGCEVNVLLMQC